MNTRCESILATIGRTPVIRINRLAPPGIELYVKAEAFNPMGSVKDRMALSVIEAAERSGALQAGQTVIEATSGNTGIGLAMVCAVKGYPLVLIDRAVPDVACDTISVDNARGAHEAVSYLIRNGHRRIGVISGLTSHNDRARARSQASRHAIGADQRAAGLNVRQHRTRAGTQNRQHSGERRHRCRDHLVARADAGCPENELDGVHAIADTDRVPRSAGACPRTFKVLALIAQHIPARVDHPLEREHA